MKRTAVINVVGLTRSLIGAHTPHIQRFVASGSLQSVKPAFPAVTCTAQSTYLTGQTPQAHGAVGNGWYDREYAELRWWKQSNRLVQQPKLWETLREELPDFTCANVFWWYNMYSSAEYTITPRPLYPADGRKVFDVHTQPMGLRDAIKQDLGAFPFPFFWGPMAGIRSSQWIAEAAKWMEQQHQPSLNLVYLPHLDYNLQRYGSTDKRIEQDLREIDTIVGELITYFEAQGVQVVLLSEYGITEVDQPVHLNRVFRANGWLSLKNELGLEYLDYGKCRAFALADHQVAHVYVNDASDLPEVKRVLEATDGVETVLDQQGKVAYGIDHERSGDLVVIAKPRAWFTYYYWEDDALAPDFARCVDIHRKAGYDPAELFFDPQLKLPKLRVLKALLKKKLGFRSLMDVIPLNADLVRGSHGRIPEDSKDWPVYISSATAKSSHSIEAVEVYEKLKSFILDENRS